jgi:hypothetical protein
MLEPLEKFNKVYSFDYSNFKYILEYLETELNMTHGEIVDNIIKYIFQNEFGGNVDCDKFEHIVEKTILPILNDKDFYVIKEIILDGVRQLILSLVSTVSGGFNINTELSIGYDNIKMIIKDNNV